MAAIVLGLVGVAYDAVQKKKRAKKAEKAAREAEAEADANAEPSSSRSLDDDQMIVNSPTEGGEVQNREAAFDARTWKAENQAAERAEAAENAPTDHPLDPPPAYTP